MPDCRGASALQATLPASCGPRPKPKTVSELLREKRLREARARKATQGPVVLPPQLLVPQPVVLQPAPTLASQDPPATGPAASRALLGSVAPAAASASWASASDLALARPEAAATASRARAPSPSQVPVGCPLSSPGQPQAPATSWKQGLPEAPRLPLAALSPTQLPTRPRSLAPTPGTHRGGPPVVASAPLPVTWVLTAPGLLPVPLPAVMGLSKPAGSPGPKGVFVTLPTFLTEMQAAQSPGQPPANSDTESGPPSTPDLTFPTPSPHQSAAEVGGDVARVPRGLPSPEEARVPRPSSPATLLADHSGAEPPWSSQLPLQGGSVLGSVPGGTSGRPTQVGESRESLGPERPPPPQPGPGKGALDLTLLSLESEAAVREWLRGQQGVCVPRLGSRLPYQPPTLCSLRALSGLLLHKKALEHRAASLIPDGAPGALQASLAPVWRALQDNPAYLLLKARFLAAFTLPALLATLAPHGVPTTLSAARQAGPGSDDSDQEEPERADGDRQPGRWATAPVQVGGPSEPRGPHPLWVPSPPSVAGWRSRVGAGEAMARAAGF